MDPDLAIFVPDLQDANIKLFFLLITFWHLHHFSNIKSHKESQNSRNQGFSYYFCLMIEGSGSVHLTNGSGSRKPKNILIRIPNTARIPYLRDSERSSKPRVEQAPRSAAHEVCKENHKLLKLGQCMSRIRNRTVSSFFKRQESQDNKVKDPDQHVNGKSYSDSRPSVTDESAECVTWSLGGREWYRESWTG